MSLVKRLVGFRAEGIGSRQGCWEGCKRQGLRQGKAGGGEACRDQSGEALSAGSRAAGGPAGHAEEA